MQNNGEIVADLSVPAELYNKAQIAIVKLRTLGV